MNHEEETMKRTTRRRRSPLTKRQHDELVARWTWKLLIEINRALSRRFP